MMKAITPFLTFTFVYSLSLDCLILHIFYNLFYPLFMSSRLTKFNQIFVCMI
jgi:hypothetical protein